MKAETVDGEALLQFKADDFARFGISYRMAIQLMSQLRSPELQRKEFPKQFCDSPDAPSNFLALLRRTPLEERRSKHIEELDGSTFRSFLLDIPNSSPLFSSKAVMLEVLSTVEWNISHRFGDKLKADYEFMVAADRGCPCSVESGYMHLASDALRSDRNFVFEVLKTHPKGIKDAAPEMWLDDEIAMAALTGAPRALQFAPDSVKADKQLVLAAVKKDGFAVKHAAEALREDREVMLAAIKQQASMLEYANADLRNDVELVLMACDQQLGLDNMASWSWFQYAGDVVKQDRGMVLRAVSHSGLAISPKLYHGDKEVVLAALGATNDNPGIGHVDPNLLQTDREILLRALEWCSRSGGTFASLQDGSLLRDITPELREDREIVLAILSSSHQALQFAPPRFQGEIAFKIAAKLGEWALPEVFQKIPKQKCTELCKAAFAGDLATLRAQLAAGEDPQKPVHSEGPMALHFAAAGGSAECVAALLGAGASADDTFVVVEYGREECGPRAGQTYEISRKTYTAKDVAASPEALQALSGTPHDGSCNAACSVE
uniref:DUF4116 domain-containing protein n=1 Tax=Pyrodinium bahamense TaxID=73915 RepID=A0A7S0AVD1_9DINO